MNRMMPANVAKIDPDVSPEASVSEDSSAGLLLLPCAVAGAGGPMQGVSGDF